MHSKIHLGRSACALLATSVLNHGFPRNSPSAMINCCSCCETLRLMIFLSRQNCTCSLSGPRRTGANAVWSNVHHAGVDRRIRKQQWVGWSLSDLHSRYVCLTLSSLVASSAEVSFIMFCLGFKRRINLISKDDMSSTLFSCRTHPANTSFDFEKLSDQHIRLAFLP
jgi:hypothetical protein